MVYKKEILNHETKMDSPAGRQRMAVASAGG
jgi:hypothetical protein